MINSVIVKMRFGMLIFSLAGSAHAEKSSSPVSDAISGLNLVAGILTGKVSSKYNPLDLDAFGNLSRDVIAIAVQKNSQLHPNFRAGDFSLTLGIERNELAHFSTWKIFTGLEEQSFVAPSLSLTYGTNSRRSINLNYQQFKTDGVQLIGVSVRESVSDISFPVDTSLGVSYSKLINGYPLKIDVASVDISSVYRKNIFNPYAGIGYSWGRTELNYVDKMNFTGDMSRVFIGLGYVLGKSLVSSELGVTGRQTYQILRFSYLY